MFQRYKTPYRRHAERKAGIKATRRMGVGLLGQGHGLTFVAIGLIITDYFLGWQAMVSAHVGVVRTNPATFLALLTALVATLHLHPLRGPSARETGLWVLVLVCAAAFPLSRPLAQMLFPDVQLGAMGANTALTLALLAASQLLRHSMRNVALALVVLAIFPPLVAANGFVMGAASFHGEMALTTLLALTGLWLSNVGRFFRHPLMRLLLRNNVPGRLIRLQLRLWLALNVAIMVLLRLIGLTDYTFYPVLHTTEMLITWGLSFVVSMKAVILLDTASNQQRRLLREARSDGLTGLATRRATNRSFNALRDEDGPFCIALIDVDHFKVVNDTYGHSTGDKVLKEIARCIRDNVRLSDIAARWGGEEFLVVLTGAQRDHGLAFCSRLRDAIANAPDETTQKTSVSVGLTSFAWRKDLVLESLVAHADDALYAAKAAGRDRVFVADDITDFAPRPVDFPEEKTRRSA